MLGTGGHDEQDQWADRKHQETEQIVQVRHRREALAKMYVLLLLIDYQDFGKQTGLPTKFGNWSMIPRALRLICSTGVSTSTDSKN